MLSSYRPGQSGNPGGRPKGVAAYLKERYGERGEKLLAAAHTIAFSRSRKCPPKVRLDAIQFLMERGWGRLPQVVSGDADAPLVHRVVFGGRYKPHE